MDEGTKDKIVAWVVGPIIALVIVAAFFLLRAAYCDWRPGYFQDDFCFDSNFRCEVDCQAYGGGRNFTGTIDRCNCDCGDAYVSICTGSVKNKTEVQAG